MCYRPSCASKRRDSRPHRVHTHTRGCWYREWPYLELLCICKKKFTKQCSAHASVWDSNSNETSESWISAILDWWVTGLNMCIILFSAVILLLTAIYIKHYSLVLTQAKIIFHPWPSLHLLINAETSASADFSSADFCSADQNLILIKNHALFEETGDVISLFTGTT